VKRFSLVKRFSFVVVDSVREVPTGFVRPDRHRMHPRRRERIWDSDESVFGHLQSAGRSLDPDTPTPYP
jgi:hypothetical protein